jgi:hypothetical protein
MNKRLAYVHSALEKLAIFSRKKHRRNCTLFPKAMFVHKLKIGAYVLAQDILCLN